MDQFDLSYGGKKLHENLVQTMIDQLHAAGTNLLGLTTLRGAYPPGSLLRLTTNELGVVVENSADGSLQGLPRVKIIADPKGDEIDGGIVDLAADKMRCIAEILDPNRFGIDIGVYF